MSEKSKGQSLIEKIFEGTLWNMRFLALFAVIFSLISALILFVLGSLDVFNALKIIGSHYIFHQEVAHFRELVVVDIIGSVDLYLIGVVLLIFSLGIYELFISKIDIAENAENPNILEIKSLDELKNKISKVIIMVLVVRFFQQVLTMEYTSPIEMLYLAFSIFILALGLYFLHKNDSH
jgi:uncharacterized membrane protein YqhA